MYIYNREKIKPEYQIMSKIDGKRTFTAVSTIEWTFLLFDICTWTRDKDTGPEKCYHSRGNYHSTAILTLTYLASKYIF
jgi:hypothetical protein